MNEGEEKNRLRFIKPVEKIPFLMRGVRTSIYDEVIDEFIKSGVEYAEVKDLGRKPVTVAQTLKNKLKKRQNKNIGVIRRKEKVYLARLE